MRERGRRVARIACNSYDENAVVVIFAPRRHDARIAAVVAHQVDDQFIELGMFPCDEYESVRQRWFVQLRFQVVDVVFVVVEVDGYARSHCRGFDRRHRA